MTWLLENLIRRITKFFLILSLNNYAVIELELTAIQWAVDKCWMYLAGTEFTAITDHQQLVGIFNGKNLDAISNQRILRIVSKLIGYQCKLLWTPAQCPIQAYNATKSSSALWHDRIKFNELRYGKRGFAIFARSFRWRLFSTLWKLSKVDSIQPRIWK